MRSCTGPASRSASAACRTSRRPRGAPSSRASRATRRGPGRRRRCRASRSTASNRSGRTSTRRSRSSPRRCCSCFRRPRPSGTAATGTPLDLAALAHSELTASLRRRCVDRVVELADDPGRRDARPEARARARPRRSNATDGCAIAPTMPAIDRYTGVLFDALDARASRPDGAILRRRARCSCTRPCSDSSAHSIRSPRTGSRTIPGCPASACARHWRASLANRLAVRGRADPRPPLGGIRRARPGPVARRQRLRAGRLGRRRRAASRAQPLQQARQGPVHARRAAVAPAGRPRSTTSSSGRREWASRSMLRAPASADCAARTRARRLTGDATHACVHSVAGVQAPTPLARRDPRPSRPGSSRRGGRRPCRRPA